MVLKTPLQLLPALQKRLVVDTVNGKVRVRAWPKPRGPNVPPQVRIQNERFTAAQRLAKLAKGSVMNRFFDATKGTGLYPRDLFTKLCLAPPFVVEMEDGRVITYGRPTLETVVFQGFRLQRAATYGVPPATLRQVPWDDPIIDTAAFWDAGADSIITIPAGVEVIELTAGYQGGGGIAGDLLARIARVDAGTDIKANTVINGGRDMTVSTGPLSVSAGQEYAFQVFFTNGLTLQAGTTFFAGTVLQATV